MGKGSWRRPTRRWLVLGACAIGAAAPACNDAASSEPGLNLVGARPEPETALLLNDDIRLTFDVPIDATTVTRDTVRLVHRVVDAEGGATEVPAAGTWEVDGRGIRFIPDGVTNEALSDGGYVPGATYELTVSGFPFLAAVRSMEGAALARSVSLTYSIVSVTEGATVLRDASLDRTARLEIHPSARGAEATRPLEWNEPLRLACDEPLDPRTIHPNEYEVREYRDPGDESHSEKKPAVIAVQRMVLEANGSEGMEAGGGARIVVYLAQPLPITDGRGPVQFVFQARAGSTPSLRDFSDGPAFRGPILFHAARQDLISSETEESYEFEFTDDLDFVPVLDPESDGTARWDGSGRVGIRYPAAAGDGADGAVTLRGSEARSDIRATRLAIAEGETVTLNGDGLVVLRAQGRIDLAGRLVRAAPSTEAPPMWDPNRRWFAENAREAECLSAWLARARATGAPWTVIIAGGDLVVTGQIDVGTPLLLVAGGRIRGTGTPQAPAGQLWLLGDGGGFDLPHHLDPGAHPNVVPPLVIDEPLGNPLVEPLTFIAISSPVPKGRSLRARLDADVFGSGGPAGSYLVQYLRADALKGGEQGLGQAVRYDEPNGALELGSPDGGAVRLRIVLVVRPGPGAWEPPYVDRVRLAWSPDRR